MNLKAVLIVSGLVAAIGLTTAAFAYIPGSGTCSIFCFDSIKNKSTDGYDPQFLKQPIVKANCLASHTDLVKAGLPDLGYCDKQLGTL